MLCYSTKNRDLVKNFESALLQGLAEDGGLYFPQEIPKLTTEELQALPSLSLQEIGVLVLHKFLSDEIDKKDLESIVNKALDFPIPLKQVGENYILEIFHGPTMAFKDVAGHTLAGLMEHFLQKQNRKATVLVATSGDTGGAIASGFGDMQNSQVIILYPKNRVSTLQEEQLTRVAHNVVSIEVDGNFDDCQRYVKKAFLDGELEKINPTSANSINIGRLLPQIIYYVYAYSRLPGDELEFFVPSGNFGNLSGALFANKMGIPIKMINACVNANDTVYKYYQTGEYNQQPSVKTISNAMDIGDPNNFPRIMEIFNYSHDDFKQLVHVDKVTDEETITTIKNVYDAHNYVLDPHTAVAWKVAEKKEPNNTKKIIVSTASPKKFAKEINDATGIEVDNLEEMQKLAAKPKRKVECPNNYNIIKQTILDIHSIRHLASNARSKN